MVDARRRMVTPALADNLPDPARLLGFLDDPDDIRLAHGPAPADPAYPRGVTLPEILAAAANPAGRDEQRRALEDQIRLHWDALRRLVQEHTRLMQALNPPEPANTAHPTPAERPPLVRPSGTGGVKRIMVPPPRQRRPMVAAE